MGVALDTSALVAIERRGRELLDALPEDGEELLLPAPVVAELWIGVELADSPGRRASRKRRIEKLVANTRPLPFDERVAPTYAAIYGELRRTGALVPANDLAIAALAVHFGHTLLVGPRDEEHFRRIRRLDVQALGRA